MTSNNSAIFKVEPNLVGTKEGKTSSKWTRIGSTPPTVEVLVVGTMRGEFPRLDSSPIVVSAFHDPDETPFPGFEWRLAHGGFGKAWINATHWHPIPELPHML